MPALLASVLRGLEDAASGRVKRLTNEDLDKWEKDLDE
jgi:hypothetical protein